MEQIDPAEINRMPSARRTQTILIVDDKERLRKGLARSLRRESCRTLTAASGEEALALSKGRKIDLVITDLVMPGMDGMALIRNIKSAVPGIEAIIITAYGSAESMQEAEELGVACYLAKPFDLSHLKSRVNELLAGKDEGGRMRTAKDEGGRLKPEDDGRPHPSSFIPRYICLAGGKTLKAAVGLSRKALPYIRPKNVMLAVMLAAGKGIRRVAAATSGLARRGRPASVFTKKEANRE